MKPSPPPVDAAAVPDAGVRHAALDITRSFIVQAPAGSGKTSLLTQRFLALLAVARQPEQVLAITFTRKAAAEMRKRLVEALERAARQVPVNDAAEATTRPLAEAVLARSAAAGWSLREHPARLRLLTIDALNQSIARLQPLASGLGPRLSTADDARPHYQEAARQTLAALEEGGTVGTALVVVLRHLGTDYARLQALLVEMLARRDHWLPVIGALGGVGGRTHAGVRPTLEAAVRELVTAELQALHVAFGPALTDFAVAAGGAAQRLLDDATRAPQGLAREALSALANAPVVPLPTDTGPAALAWWRGLAAVCLTKGGAWRKKLTIDEGFPPKLKSEKAAFTALLDSVADDDALAERLAGAAELPAPQYTATDWAVIEAILVVLRRAAAELQVAFASAGQVDHTAVAQGAREALGHPEAPTEAALALDRRISHVLVDEFQDTSATQVRLLEALTAGWEAGDGRTLFCVGDPMQSIYRFRQAEVALFLAVRNRGLGGVRLESLRLEANFRSQARLVEFFNATFRRVLPAADDIGRSAVAYAPSIAMRGPLAGEAVSVQAFLPADLDGEARAAVEIVRGARARLGRPTIAILARSRSHLTHLALALRAAGIAYQGVDLVPLGERTAVRDVAALARAILHAGDRTAWWSVLRAPWCALSLGELESLAGVLGRDGLVPDLWAGDALLPVAAGALPADGAARLQRTLSILAAAARQSAQGVALTLAARVEGAWLALGGPACLPRGESVADVERFLDALTLLESGGQLPDGEALEEALAGLFSAPEPAPPDAPQLMTIHRAKGLEFDVVILPGLGRTTRHNEPPLLQWEAVAAPGREAGLLLAPVRGAAEERAPLAALLQARETERQRHELERLLYVAATRAIRELHLLVQVKPAKRDPGTLARPDNRSALAALWPALEGAVVAAAAPLLAAAAAGEAVPGPTARVPSPTTAARPPRWQLDAARLPPPPGLAAAAPPTTGTAPEAPIAEVAFEWASELIRVVGVVVHAELQALAALPALGTGTVDIDAACHARVERALAAAGLPADTHLQARARVLEALQATLQDPRGRWLLGEGTHAAESELALTGIDGDDLVNVILDRTFVDAAGTRWIIDWKTSAHEGTDRDAFLDNEQRRYMRQLERYARLLQGWLAAGGTPSPPIRLGLYFPLLRGWREWPAAVAASG
jgi:ATP-dependent helicase/nuclease subunit A